MAVTIFSVRQRSFSLNLTLVDTDLEIQKKDFPYVLDGFLQADKLNVEDLNACGPR